MSGCAKITVVTPSFNQGKFIEETIKSIISQEGDFTLEYIIMDGGSTDETVEVIKKYERLLEKGEYPVKCRGVALIWKSEKDRGQTHAVNKGFKLATGDVLGWVNSDDTYMPGAISKALDYFAKHEDVMMVYGEGYYINRAGAVIERFKTLPFDYNKLAEYCFICQPSAFIRKNLLDTVGYLDESLNMCMDYDYWIRIGRSYNIGYIPFYLSGARLYDDTKTALNLKDSYSEAIKIVNRYYGYVPACWIYGYIESRFDKYLKPGSIFKNAFSSFFKLFFFRLISLRVKYRLGL